MVHIECVGQSNHHNRNNKSAPNYKNDIDNPSEECSWVKVAIAYSGHRDNSEPNSISYALDLIRIKLAIKMFGVLSYQVPSYEDILPFSDSQTHSKHQNTACKDHQNERNGGIFK